MSTSGLVTFSVFLHTSCNAISSCPRLLQSPDILANQWKVVFSSRTSKDYLRTFFFLETRKIFSENIDKVYFHIADRLATKYFELFAGMPSKNLCDGERNSGWREARARTSLVLNGSHQKFCMYTWVLDHNKVCVNKATILKNKFNWCDILHAI